MLTIIASNKIDAISGLKKNNEVGKKRIESQIPKIQSMFEEKIFDMIGTLYDQGFQADLYYNIKDFRKTD